MARGDCGSATPATGLTIGPAATRSSSSSSPAPCRLDVNPDTLLDVKAVFRGRKEGALGGNWVLAGTWSAVAPRLFQLEYGKFAPLSTCR